MLTDAMQVPALMLRLMELSTCIVLSLTFMLPVPVHLPMIYFKVTMRAQFLLKLHHRFSSQRSSNFHRRRINAYASLFPGSVVNPL